MGSGIAAHLANAGIEVLLLDIVPPKLEGDDLKVRAKRNAFADGGLKKALKSKPAAFFHKANAHLVETGNTDDDLGRLSGCDLVIEAIIERLDIKQSLFAKLEKILPDHAIVASNTSGLRIADMMDGRGDAFKKRFLVMHFFNPVRYMKLLELVAGPDTDPATMDRIRDFGENELGKGIVFGKDTPNFVGNRIGAHSMMVTIHQMLEDGLTPEDVDGITGKAMAHPKSASFRTADLVGLDTFVHVADNCHAALEGDEDRAVFEVPSFIRGMVEKKLLGNKTRGGFYKKDKSGISVIDAETLEYRPKGGDEAIRGVTKGIAKSSDPKKRVRKLVADEGKAGQFAWKVLSRSLAYSARRIGEIADSIVAVDDAMKWGYNWELGPFETWDALGFIDTTERMKKDGVTLPDSIQRMVDSGATAFYSDDGKVFDLLKGEYVALERDPRTAPLGAVRRGEAAVLTNDGAEAWDLGDGVLGVSFKTKANSLDDDVIAMLDQAVDEAEKNYESILIFNEGDHFSVGANLFAIVMAANNKQWDQLESVVKKLQDTAQKMKYAKVPVVAAPWGMTLGGGMEVCLACDAVQAASETYSGLVEVGVGVIPGGAGNMNMLWRALEGVPEGAQINTLEIVANTFKNIAMAKVATSAEEAKHFGYFRWSDGVSFDKARLLHEAKQKAIGMARSDYHPPVRRAHKLPGESGVATLEMMVGTLVDGGYATEHDAFIAKKLARVLCGGASGGSHPVTEQEVLDLAREAFVSLCGEKKSLDRMQHMLMHNKPLRN